MLENAVAFHTPRLSDGIVLHLETNNKVPTKFCDKCHESESSIKIIIPEEENSSLELEIVTGARYEQASFMGVHTSLRHSDLCGKRKHCSRLEISEESCLLYGIGIITSQISIIWTSLCDTDIDVWYRQEVQSHWHSPTL
jgi:hypothetical protein